MTRAMVRRDRGDGGAGEIVLSFDLSAQAASVLALLKKYADRDIDLADACIVRMSELERDCRVAPVDRRDSRSIAATGGMIPVIAPPARA